jgi:Uma2 family endonuclease
VIYAMAGESGNHGDITVNLVVLLGSQLKGKPCRVRTKDTKVRSGPSPVTRRTMAGLYSYPDVVVICDEPDYHDAHQDVILNPTVIIEVLSESTEGFDRGEKFKRFQRWNPTLKDYLLVSQDQPQIDHFTRQADGKWTYEYTTGLSERVYVASIQCTLPLAEVYERVVFPPMETESAAAG